MNDRKKSSNAQNDPFLDDQLIEAALRRAVKKALREHKRAGNPIAILEAGKVVWLPPEQIPVSDREP